MTNFIASASGKKVAGLICHSETVLDPRRWLGEEVGDLATTIPNLDGISPQAIRPLAKLVEVGTADATRLSNALSIDLDTIGEYLDQLCEFDFVEQHGTGFQATTSGARALEAIGRRIINRQRYELRRQLEEVERIR